MRSRAITISIATPQPVHFAAIIFNHAQVLAMRGKPIENAQGLAEVAPPQLRAQPRIEMRANGGAIALPEHLAARATLRRARLQRLHALRRDRMGCKDAAARLAPAHIRIVRRARLRDQIGPDRTTRTD